MSRRRITAIPKDYRDIVQAAVNQGWTLTQTRHAHPKLTSPDGSYATPIPSSSTNPRLRKAVIVRLRANGLVLEDA